MRSARAGKSGVTPLYKWACLNMGRRLVLPGDLVAASLGRKVAVQPHQTGVYIPELGRWVDRGWLASQPLFPSERETP